MCREGEQLPGGRRSGGQAGAAACGVHAAGTAVRASAAAAPAGATDPLVYAEAELARHCGLPPQDATMPAVLADAGAAMALSA